MSPKKAIDNSKDFRLSVVKDLLRKTSGRVEDISCYYLKDFLYNLNRKDFWELFPPLSEKLQTIESLIKEKTNQDLKFSLFLPNTHPGLDKVDENQKKLYFILRKNKIEAIILINLLNIKTKVWEKILEILAKIPTLKELFVSDSNIKKLPKTLGELTSLTGLFILNSNLKKLPELIFKLKNLEILDLSRNKLDDIPDLVGNLKQLIELKLSDNNLSTLSDSFLHHRNGLCINTSGNPLQG